MFNSVNSVVSLILARRFVTAWSSWSLGTWQNGHGRQVESLWAGSAVQS
ncbi:hypothetical protein QUF58_08350 [Anaerolineales bacterium HSG24]|nr:hypothetical protein [Anaerolineales bacterium HSG24]